MHYKYIQFFSYIFMTVARSQMPLSSDFSFTDFVFDQINLEREKKTW